MSIKLNHTAVDRFLKYVTIDTESDPFSTTFPSTEKQKNLGKLLVEQLLEMGIKDAHLDDYGYVYATIPANTEKENVPVICFCSHVDTSPDASGKDVKPIVHKNYDGTDIILPDNPAVVIRMKDHRYLKDQIGHDVITASGNTLLGADNKAGLSEIMDMTYQLVNNPSIKHGKIRLLFTPDEEIGKGANHVDLKKLGADFGYTVDGSQRGSIEDETFSADGATITIHGVGIHPGFAKGKLENAVKIAGDILANLPIGRLSPETTSGKQGFIHPTTVEGSSEKAVIRFIIRDFTDEKLNDHAAELRAVMDTILKRYPNSKATLDIKEQYRNMKKILDKHPQVVDYALEAIERAGMKATRNSIRGGTDGSRLSFMGLPCPNIFTGGHAFHGPQEWVSRQDMEKTVQTLVELVQIWEERA
ncbi:MAG: peptidase T [Saprospiraceae bacterium]